MDCSPPGSSVHGISPGKNTGVGCHALLQGIFPTQGSNPRLLCLLHWQAGLYHKSHLGSHSTLLLLLLSHFSRVRLCATPQMRPHRRQPTRLLHPWDFPGKSTGVGCHCLLRTSPPYNYRNYHCCHSNQVQRSLDHVKLCLPLTLRLTSLSGII